LAGGPVTSVTCIGVTRDHSRFYLGGLGSLVECASCGSHGKVSGDCPLQCILIELWYSGNNYKLMFVLRSSTWCHGEMLWQSYSHVWTIKWWPVVGGSSRHSCSEDRSLISPKGYRNDIRLMQVLEMEK